jgi:hypothetical protein
LRTLAPSFVRPINTTSTAPNDPSVGFLGDHAIPLLPSEELTIEGVHSSGSVQTIYCVLFGRRTHTAAPRGDVVTLRGTSSTVCTLNAWTRISVTWDNIPPRGTFSVIGTEVTSAAPIAFRLGLIEENGLRPGGISVLGTGSETHPMFRNGLLGEWGRFAVPAMPEVFIFAAGGASGHRVYLDVVRID